MHNLPCEHHPRPLSQEHASPPCKVPFSPPQYPQKPTPRGPLSLAAQASSVHPSEGPDLMIAESTSHQIPPTEHPSLEISVIIPTHQSVFIQVSTHNYTSCTYPFQCTNKNPPPTTFPTMKPPPPKQTSRSSEAFLKAISRFARLNRIRIVRRTNSQSHVESVHIRTWI